MDPAEFSLIDQVLWRQAGGSIQIFDLTRTSVAEALSVFFVVVGLYLLLQALVKRDSEGSSTAMTWATTVAGLLVLVVTIVLRPGLPWEAIRLKIDGTSRIGALAVVGVSALVGVAVADYVTGRIIPLIGSWGASSDGSPTRRSGVGASAMLSSGLLLAGAAFVVLPFLNPRVGVEVSEGTRLDVSLVTELELQSGPRDLVFTGPTEGFLSLKDSISRFSISGEGQDLRLSLAPVDTSIELQNTKGLTVADGYLFVVRQGSSEPNQPEGLFSTNGSVVRFDVGEDGSLSNGTVVLDQLPVANSIHATNGITTGPDGLLYMSIGAPYIPEGGSQEWPSQSPNVNWLGTILRFDTDGKLPEVFAKGLRNVYDIEFDTRGRLWGVDNDGVTFRDFRAEEVLQIKEDANYGYPFEGTFGEYEIRSDGPVWTYTGREVEGSAGLETADELGLSSGLLIGARQLTYLRLSESPAGVIASADFDLNGTEVVFERQGYFTVVEAGPDGLLLVGVDGGPLSSNLYALRVTE